MLRSFVPIVALISATTIFGAWHAPALANDRPTATPQRAAIDEGDGGDSESNDDENKPGDRARDAGSVRGEVVSVDYRTNRMTVRSGSTTYDITVLPSTDFRGRTDSFHGFTDIKRGAHVDVLLSQRARTLTAQIIHLR